METTFKLEAINILKKAKRPLTSEEITKEIIKRKNVKIMGKTPRATLYSILITEIKKKGNKSTFIKIGREFSLR
ncbi:winged helix-turn-helix domain-containing protein [Candidatus Pacearchaeota archaeon]|nr:winged helix-turn-helix domain-containing protein [Candidatus Pacearchaeota archaeon]